MFLSDLLARKLTLPTAADALPGRPAPIPTAGRHFVSGRPLFEPWPEGFAVVDFGLGCFWGAERKFWQVPGVYVTAVGYEGGLTPNPTYQEVCTGMTGHAEVVRVVYDPKTVSFARLLAVFFETHDPTQGMRQGNDTGTQYRSVIYVEDPERLAEAKAARDAYGAALKAAGIRRAVTTEISAGGPFFYAEDYHQQYLAKNPDGYCGLGGTGVSCPVGLGLPPA